MSHFEELMGGFCGNIEAGRDARVARNKRVFELGDVQATLLDELSCGATIAVAQLIGKRLDCLTDQRLCASAMILLPNVIAANMHDMSGFLDSVLALTAMDGEITAPNPDKPDCDCSNCQLARAASHIMAVPIAEGGER